MLEFTPSADTPSRDELLERAAAMRELLMENAEETDRLRRLPDPIVATLKEAGLCRLMVPKRFGGYQTDIHTYIAVMAELGRGCGATAWVAGLINVCAWLAGLFPERAQRDVWGANPHAWIAGSLAPHGLATPVEGAGASRDAGHGRRAACTRSGAPAAFA
ncbi:MAG TPA: acyl-CoA dehydrogenase family protein [Gammaproteobacteria bacterium]